MIRKVLRQSLCLIALNFLIIGVCRADIRRVGVQNLFVAGVPTAQFKFFAAPNTRGRQEESEWCWAASIQMVLNYDGLLVNQPEIVQRVFGRLVNHSAQAQQVMKALSGWAPNVHGGYSRIKASPYTFGAAQIVSDLAHRWPLIVGLKLQGPKGPIGHAVVLTGIAYSAGPGGIPMFRAAIIRDPWPWNPSRQVIPWQVFWSHVMFMVHVYVQ